MKLPKKIDLLAQQQAANGNSGGRISQKDLAIAKPLNFKNRLPVIQLETGANIKNTRGTIKDINRLSPYYFS